MGDWPRHYILMDRTPIAVDMETWARSLQSEGRRIGADVITDKCHVSTVFLGFDHNHYGHGDPILFETMIFGGPLDGDQWRYTTYADAERGHQEAVAKARIACAQVKAIADNVGATS